jgi:transcriptional regulator with XRE-family HTH domain
MNLNVNIREIRESKRLKQIEVSDALNMDNSQYAKFEKRGKKLSLEQIESLSEVLGVSIYEILGIEEKTTITSEDKDKEIEELKKRIAELEDRVKDKEKILSFTQNQTQKLFTVLLNRRFTQILAGFVSSEYFQIESPNFKLVDKQKFNNSNNTRNPLTDVYSFTEISGDQYFRVNVQDCVGFLSSEKYNKVLHLYFKEDWVRFILESGYVSENELIRWKKWKEAYPELDNSDVSETLDSFMGVFKTLFKSPAIFWDAFNLYLKSNKIDGNKNMFDVDE